MTATTRAGNVSKHSCHMRHSLLLVVPERIIHFNVCARAEDQVAETADPKLAMV